MYITVDKLVPGVILSKDVIGKSSKLLIAKHTILTDEHIHFLSKFLIEKVAIEPRLHDGTLFVAK